MADPRPFERCLICCLALQGGFGREAGPPCGGREPKENNGGPGAHSSSDSCNSASATNFPVHPKSGASCCKAVQPVSFCCRRTAAHGCNSYRVLVVKV